MFPDQLISVMVALTEANKQNGCLQVIKGSHKLGRVNHGFAGEQMGTDMQMVNNALKTMELVYVELEAGDALIFYSNLEGVGVSLGVVERRESHNHTHIHTYTYTFFP